MEHDNRTKPQSQWTFYVVDDLPTMANLYRFDTVEEAITKYMSLPENMRSAIGSSIDGRHEIDHIHRCDGRHVLVTDCVGLSPWEESPQIQEAIDTMIAYLNVQYQYRQLFGNRFPSAIVDLERYSGVELEHYFSDKLLRPDNPENLFTAVQEVYAEGEGWMKLDDFLKKLDDSRPGRPGEGAKNVFVDRLNINYITDTGRCGQADISPRNYALLHEKTLREVSPEKLAQDLYQFAADLDPYESADQEDTKEEELALMKRDISSHSLSAYTQMVSEALKEGLPSEEDHKKALSLLSRLTVLTPPDFRKRSLATMIQSAEHKAAQQNKPTQQRWIELEH